MKRFLVLVFLNLSVTIFSQTSGDFILEGTVLVRYQGTARDVIIPANLGITRIGSTAFIGTNIISVIIPHGVTAIDKSAFGLCRSLTTISIPTTVSSIGDGAFFACEKLASITIPSSVVAIGEGAFINCSSLTRITVPANVVVIGDGAFEECRKLAEITVDQRNIAYSSVDGVLFDKTRTRLIQYPAGKQGQTYIIPNGIRQIGESAFYGCENLISITIPISVFFIGDTAFAECSRLTTITIPASVKEIGDGAFTECNVLSSAISADITRRFGESIFIWVNEDDVDW